MVGMEHDSPSHDKDDPYNCCMFLLQVVGGVRGTVPLLINSSNLTGEGT